MSKRLTKKQVERLAGKNMEVRFLPQVHNYATLIGHCKKCNAKFERETPVVACWSYSAEERVKTNIRRLKDTIFECCGVGLE